MRAMPPEALGIESKRAGREGATRHHPPLHHRFAVCSPRRDVLARKVKLLAHDIKPVVGCLAKSGLLLPAGQVPAARHWRWRFPISFQDWRAVTACAAPIARPTHPGTPRCA